MNYKSKNVIICTCSFILSLVVWVGCEVAFQDYCYDHINDTFAVFVMLFAPLTCLFSFILLFLKEESFQLWQNFAVVWIPLSLLLIVISPAQSDCFFGSGFICNGFDREGMIWFTAGIFFIVSLIIIAVKSWKLRGK
ncbi:MAG: hypothetical protein WC878_00285 [Candidatus Paceibacterota bacterium]|jgi:hypothetical protein